MHAREFVELAALISAHGPTLIQSEERIPAASIEQYWTTSKVRLDRWAWRLRGFADRAGGSADADVRRRRAQWPEVRGALEEILTGEMLTRVWTAVLCGYDRRHGGNEVEPVARSVLIGHMEARHRALTLLVRGPGIDADAAAKLNRLRRRVEHWTDLLVGHLAGIHDVGEFAFDPQRAQDFAGDLQYRSDLQGGRQAWPLALASLRVAFRQELSPQSPNADLNARIAASILSCFPPELFDSTGLLRSLWLMRLTNVAEDTQGMIDALLGVEWPAAMQKTAAHSDISGRHSRRFGGH
jgi:hypothetical protein